MGSTSTSYVGEVVTIIGESGSGKSILLKAMMGLVEVDGGTIRFDGEEVTGQTEREWVATRQRIGMLFQESALFDSLDVLRERRLRASTSRPR